MCQPAVIEAAGCWLKEFDCLASNNYTAAYYILAHFDDKIKGYDNGRKQI